MHLESRENVHAEVEITHPPESRIRLVSQQKSQFRPAQGFTLPSSQQDLNLQPLPVVCLFGR
jgi:hypothetical protein